MSFNQPSRASIPLRHRCPCFRSPYFRTFFRLNGKCFDIFKKNVQFSSAKISDDLLFSHWLKCLISPYFRSLNSSVPLFQQNYYFPYYSKFTPDFVKFTCFYIHYVLFVPPLVWPWCIYASHNACTGRPCQPCFWLFPLRAAYAYITGLNTKDNYKTYFIISISSSSMFDYVSNRIFLIIRIEVYALLCV